MNGSPALTGYETAKKGGFSDLELDHLRSESLSGQHCSVSVGQSAPKDVTEQLITGPLLITKWRRLCHCSSVCMSHVSHNLHGLYFCNLCFGVLLLDDAHTLWHGLSVLERRIRSPTYCPTQPFVSVNRPLVVLCRLWRFVLQWPLWLACGWTSFDISAVGHPAPCSGTFAPLLFQVIDLKLHILLLHMALNQLIV